MSNQRNPAYVNLTTQELKKARDKAQDALLSDERTSISSDDPVYKRWSQLCWEEQFRRKYA